MFWNFLQLHGKCPLVPNLPLTQEGAREYEFHQVSASSLDQENWRCVDQVDKIVASYRQVLEEVSALQQEVVLPLKSKTYMS